MQIRSITLGVDAAAPLAPSTCREAASFFEHAQRAFEQADFAVQTTRLSTQPAHRFLAPDALPEFAKVLEAACAGEGIGHCAIGGIEVGGAWTETAASTAVADAVCATQNAFFSLHVATDRGVNYRAARAGAATIARIATQTAQGLGNLRFAALAQCPANIPFFPAAYHAGGPRRFSLALQAADVAVDAFAQPGSLAEVEAKLVAAFEEAGARFERVAGEIEKATGVIYAGADLSPAQFPVDQASTAGALESLGVARFGAAGTVLAAWRLTSALKRVRLKQCGFSGLMMPLLEDSVLALRAIEGFLSVNELLLFSAICGTGLDTVPLPGSVGESELAGILLDVAALATALKKPLTARLFPLPGKNAGDPTEIDFPLFTNSRVLAVKGYGADALIARGIADG